MGGILDGIMELHLLEKDKDSISVQIHSPNMTVIQPLINELLEDDGVAEVKYNTGHPELDIPVLFVRVKSGKPQTALKRAAKTIANEFKEAREKLDKSK
jgi:DNA-directed RNA polymerase subunit L